MPTMHPDHVLFNGRARPPIIPACDHYAGSEQLMQKSLDLQQTLAIGENPSFDITLDCEDGAATGDEEAHARLIGHLLDSEKNYFNRVGVRVHDVSSSFCEQDIALICAQAAQRIAFLVLPKIETITELNYTIDLINRHAASAGRHPEHNPIPIHVVIETHHALTHVQAIAALPQVECLSFGIMDFVSAHYGAISASAMRSPGQFEHPLITRAKLEISAACHAHGKTPSHNVTTEIKDLSVVTNDAHRAAHQFGYTRMWSIHPKQIEPILTAFAPRHTEIEEATIVLTAAQSNAWGPIQYNQRLYDRASYRYYWTILKRAHASGLPLPKLARVFFETPEQSIS